MEYQSKMEELNNSEDAVENLNVTMYESFQSDRIRTVCCAFKSYVQCSEETVRRSCGQEPAVFTKKFLDKMASSLMSVSTDWGLLDWFFNSNWPPLSFHRCTAMSSRQIR